MSPADPNYIAHRERETARFEARAHGGIPHRPKMQPQNGADTMLQATEEIAPSPLASPRRVSMPADVVINGSDQTPGPQSLLDVILHAGSDPRFDVEKFRTLVQMQREEEDRRDARADRQAALAAEAAFDAALSEVQGKIAPIAANQYNSQTRSRYADYAALDRVIKPIYAPAGFSLSFDEEDSPKADHIRVICWVTLVAPGAKRSHKRKYHADMPADGKGARGGDVMTKTHAASSAFTYGQRRVACNIFNIAIDKDDDGNAAGAKAAAPVAVPPGTIAASQAAEIRKLLEDRGIRERSFLNYIRLPSIEHIGVAHFERAKAAIIAQGRKS